jgi:two-component system, NtrC family, sensor kinase
MIDFLNPNAQHDESKSGPRAFSDSLDTDEDYKGKIENIALRQRPSISIRTRLILAFSLIFAMCVLITLWSIYFMAKIQIKIDFLETSGNYRAEILEARRYEKNYLLYGTNLEDALNHLQNAEQILSDNSRTITEIVGQSSFQVMKTHLDQYHFLLSELIKPHTEEKQNQIEPQLRDHGSLMISLALDFEKKERASVDKMLTLARRVPFIFLGLLLICMVFIASFLARQLLGTLARFMEYTKRIGEGDFTPITPQKKYRDEFTQLAVAFNQMIHELDRRHNILVESHKLRAVGTLVAGVAHELNNPLNNTMLTASMLQEDYQDLTHDEKEDMLNDIIRETERSQKIVRNLLDFARESETQSMSLHLNEILNGSIRLVANQLKLAKVNLITNLMENLPPIHGDAQMLQQVFINLILNAADVLPEKGKIMVSTSKNDDKGYVIVEVKDNGPGIPEHILSRIFEPFFTTKARGKGTGLGLSVSRGIIRKLGGYIQVKSKLGEGTTFSIFLPATNIPSNISAG